MTIEELKKLAERKHIHIPSGYKKLDIIEYINDEIARMKGDKKKSIIKSKTKVKSPARIHYAPVNNQIYAPVNNIVNNYYTVPEIKEIAKVNKIETPSGIRKEELIELVNEILNDKLKNKTPVKIPKELSKKSKSPVKVKSPTRPKSPVKEIQQQQQPKQQQQQQQQQPKQQKPQQQQQQPKQQKPQQQQQQPKQQQQQEKPQQKPKSPSRPKSKTISPRPKSPSRPKSKTISPRPKSKTISPKPKSKTISPRPKSPTPKREELPELKPFSSFSEEETPQEYNEETPEEFTEEEFLSPTPGSINLPTLPSSPVKSKSIKTKFLPRVVEYDEEE